MLSANARSSCKFKIYDLRAIFVQKKTLRKNRKRNQANRKSSTLMKDLLKANLKQIKARDQKVKNDFIKTVKAIDKAVKAGIIKTNTASRYKSHLQKKINALK